METLLTANRFAEHLAAACSRETSSDPEGWTPENPFWGHCAVVALIAQERYGGELMRVSLEGTPFAAMRSHYFNRFPDGDHDFSGPQFGDVYPSGLKAESRTRAYLLSSPETRKRYKLMSYRVARRISESGSRNALFDDEVYQACYEAALNSPCQKMRFGCVIVHNGMAVYQGSNTTIGPLASLCEGRCIRLDIQSRTESMLGSCGHAEEGMWDVIHQGIPISECELYVAGVHMNGDAWIKSAAEHSCLRCAVQMHRAKLKAVHVPMHGGWARLSTEQALATAMAYATKQKAI